MSDTPAPIYPLAITDESLDCIIEQAGYGIGYWAIQAVYDPAERTYKVLDSDDQQEYVLSYEKIIESFWDLANFAKQIEGTSQNGYVRKYIYSAVVDGIVDGKGDIDAGHIDAAAADMIIQHACFGRIIYG